jgi:hypothetical protein
MANNPPELPPPAASPAEAKNQLSAFTTTAVEAMERISKVAEKGPTNLLLSLGTLLVLFALAMKAEIGGVRIASLAPSEFISLLVVATLLLVVASCLRLYQFKSGLDTLRAQQKAGADILTRTTEVAASLAKPVSPAPSDGPL